MTHQSSGVSSSADLASPSTHMTEMSEGLGSNEDMINLYTCDFEQFAVQMSKQYGKDSFTKGYQIITKNKEFIYTEEGEEQLVSMLRPFFKSEDLIRGFLNLCTSYIIVQNYSQNISQA